MKEIIIPLELTPQKTKVLLATINHALLKGGLGINELVNLSPVLNELLKAGEVFARNQEEKNAEATATVSEALENAPKN